MDYQMQAREWRLIIESSPPVTGRTSYGGNVATVQPEHVTIVEVPSGTVWAKATGPRILKSGAVGRAYAEVEVVITRLDGGTMDRTPHAPEWLAEVYREVS